MRFYPILITVFCLFSTMNAFNQNAEEKTECRSKKAIIFGITGQDGAYLTELLLTKGYVVHGIIRQSTLSNVNRLEKYIKGTIGSLDNLYYHYGDLTDSINVLSLIDEVQPDEIYNLGAQSHVRVSFDLPEYTSDVDALGTLRILEAIKRLGLAHKVKFYQAATSEMFGLVQERPQTESTPFYPRSPYGVSKLYAYWITVNYRESYGIFACNGILFNHESPFRGENFVTRKITIGACRYKLGLQKILYLGNLNAMRDWGFARDYVEAMWLMLQHEKPDDFVIATGETHSVREFVELVFKELGIDIEWRGEGVDEEGINKTTGELIIKIDPQLYRPSEVDYLLGKSEKAKQVLKWQPKVCFSELIRIMVAADLDKATKERYTPSS